MAPASILLAFLAIIAPGVVVYLGLLAIKAVARHRAAKVKAAQDKEMREHDERQERMAKMRAVRRQSDQRVLEARTLHDHKRAMLRSVPKPPEPPPSRRDDASTVSSSLDNNWPVYSISTHGVAADSDPARTFIGGGGTFDGGGSSGDWSSSDSCSSSDSSSSSSSSDSGSCGSGD